MPGGQPLWQRHVCMIDGDQYEFSEAWSGSGHLERSRQTPNVRMVTSTNGDGGLVQATLEAADGFQSRVSLTRVGQRVLGS